MSFRKIVLAMMMIVALLIALNWYFVAKKAPGSGGNADTDVQDAPIPVTAVAAAISDVPVYLTALGTVQALNTVTVNAQVSGQIKAIHFQEGQEMKQDDLIAEIDPRTFQAALDQAEAKARQDAAQLSASRSTLSRYQNLSQKHFVAAQDLENQSQIVSQQEAMVSADQAAVANARTQLGFTRIVAPITGVAGIRQIDVGNLVSANTGGGIVVLTQIHPLNVIFTLPQQSLDEVRSADTTALPVTAYNRTDSHPIAQGVLKVIDNTIDAQTGTFRLKAEFQNEKSELWPGQFVNVKLQTRTLHDALVIPVPAVQRGPESSYVYLVQGDNTVAMRTIETGMTAGDGGVLVTSGLKRGDRVVTEGQFRLKPGAKVLPLAPGENAPALSAEELKKAAVVRKK
ncbi:MAG: efflux RND transporter periplasmic adaptor subunit [Rhodanobacter sp.]|jgi:multidrug efflux system membrane fusion protein|nr:efflux RND transporter periplasmic adaptor subunit [Rhodanobacter sp.]